MCTGRQSLLSAAQNYLRGSKRAGAQENEFLRVNPAELFCEDPERQLRCAVSEEDKVAAISMLADIPDVTTTITILTSVRCVGEAIVD